MAPSPASRAPHVVVTGVRNPVHLVHVAAYLRTLLEEFDDTITVRHLGGGRTLGRIRVDDEVVRHHLPDDPRLDLTLGGPDPWRTPPGRDLHYVAIGAPGLKPYARMLAARRGRPFTVVVTDEGLGTYGTWSTRRDALRRQGVRDPWATVRSAAVQTGSRVLTTRRFALYERDGAGEWAVSEPIAAEFARQLGGDPGSMPDAGDGRVVLLTQPWIALGVLSPETWLGRLRTIADRVREDGRELVVRLHPAEDPTTYEGFPLLPARGPAELDPAVVGAAELLGGPSTALVNVAALYGVPARRLLIPELAGLEDDLSDDQRSLLDRWAPGAW
ncbi:hypothetical protein ACQBAU_05495 [Propionibacteriaceae bacterium Y2011]